MVESAEICDVTHPEFVNHLSMNKPNTTGIITITNRFDVVGISITLRGFVTRGNIVLESLCNADYVDGVRKSHCQAWCQESDWHLC